MPKLITALILVLLSNPLLAGERHKKHKAIKHTTETINTTTSVYSNTSITNGIALSIAASQHHFDFGTYGLQGSLAVGNYNGSEAFSFSLGKRFKRILLNASYGVEKGNAGVGLGLNWRF